MTGLDPLKIPLKADPGKPPLLEKGWGHISMSHCSDALLVGWSLEKIGVDLETLRPDQAKYIGVKVEGPYKPDYYRY